MPDVNFDRHSEERKRAHTTLKKAPYLTTLCEVCRLVDFEYLFFGSSDTGFRHSRFSIIYYGRASDVAERVQSSSCPFCQQVVLSSVKELIHRDRSTYPTREWEPQDELPVLLWATDPNRPELVDDEGYCAVHVGLQKVTWLNAVTPAIVPGSMFQDELDPSDLRSTEPLRLLNYPRLSRSLSLEAKANLGSCRQWFETCQSNHTNCSHEAQFDAAIGSEVNKHFKLIDLSSHHIVEFGQTYRLRYATLSYVCGRSDTLWKLPKASKLWRTDEMGRQIHPLPLNLPSTISDALVVTGSLGLQYLWVDSFCIAQDDPVELQAQIQRLYYIYTYSSVCIVAGSGEDSHYGIPGVSQNRAVDPRYKVGLKEGFSIGLPTSALHELLVQYKWMKRGWTYQELILPRRCLIFTGQQAYFYCGSVTYSESYSDAYPSTDRRLWRAGGSGAYAAGNINDIRSASLAKGPSNIVRAYAATVREYSRRELSYPTDGLNAFQGLSTLMGYLMKTEMIFGCPKTILVNCLTWRRNEVIADAIDRPQRRMKARPEDVDDEKHMQPCFPSWAWVGWECRYRDLRLRTFPYYFWGSEMLILDTSLIPPIRAPFGLNREFLMSDGEADGSSATIQGVLPILTKVATVRMILDEDVPGHLDVQTPNGDSAGHVDIRGSQDRWDSQQDHGRLIQFWMTEQDGKPRDAEVMLVRPSGLPTSESLLGEEHLKQVLRERCALKTAKPLTAHRMRMKDARFMSQMSADCPSDVRVPSPARGCDQVPEVFLASRIGVGFVRSSTWVNAKPRDAIVLLG